MGLLSNATANLVAALNQLRGLGGLPPAAQATCTQLQNLLDPVAPSVVAIQVPAAMIIGTLQNALGRSLALINQLQPHDPIPGSITATVEAMKAQIASLDGNVEAEMPIVQHAFSSLPAINNQIAQIESDLKGQSSTVSGELIGKQSALDAAKKKYYYLLALGPLGLVGLAVALAIYEKLRSEVDGIQSQINQLQSQQALVNAMSGATAAVQQQIGTVFSKLEDVMNTLHLISSTLDSITGDISANGSPEILKMMFGAAVSELNALSNDIS